MRRRGRGRLTSGSQVAGSESGASVRCRPSGDELLAAEPGCNRATRWLGLGGKKRAGWGEDLG